MEQQHLLPPGPPDGRRGGLSRALPPERIRERLAAGPDPQGRSDPALARHSGGIHRPGAWVLGQAQKPAAVLVPLVERAEMMVLLTQRTDHLAHHAGQISFPGGRLEEADGGDPVACALRETEEEIGLSPRHVAVAGRLDDYYTGTGFKVTPIVGLVTPPFDTRPDPFEVAELFEVPLAFLIDPDNQRLCEREVAGKTRPFWSIVWRERVIWGATAGMLVNLSHVLQGP